MNTLLIDLETFSSTDLAKSGVYCYCQSPDFEILLFGYSVDGGEVQVVDLANGESLPPEIITALTDDSVIKWAFNSQFERICLSRWLQDNNNFPEGYLSPASWRCLMIWSAYMGLPLSLEGAGKVLGLEKQKLTEGKALIRYFCTPCKPTKANNQRIRNLPKDAPDKWETFKAYNRRDVETELTIQERLFKFPVPFSVWEEYQLDQQINDRGVALDMKLVHQAIHTDQQSRSELTSHIKKLTVIANPNSVQQMKRWLSDNGIETASLDKEAVVELLKTAPDPIAKVLRLRQSLAKSSIKKYTAMEEAACRDNRARGMFQFYGANRTGRWSGRLIQLQNLYRNSLPDLSQARSLVKDDNITALNLLYDSVPEVLSELIRTAFIPKDGCKFIVADFSSIERVVLAWLSKENWVLNAYAVKEDLYTATASQIFGVPVEQIDRKSSLRQKGKVADLACGYGGSVGALKAMGALSMGLSEEELKPLVTAWRSANPNIVRLWRMMETAAIEAVKGQTTKVACDIRFSYQSGMLFITLPSGRRLSYVKPRIDQNQFGSSCVSYEGIGSTKKWERIKTFGGKLTENIVQAIARDILAFSMQTLREHSIVMHIHDEIVIEAEKKQSIEEICALMSRMPTWAKGLSLRVDGFETMFYKKD